MGCSLHGGGHGHSHGGGGGGHGHGHSHGGQNGSNINVRAAMIHVIGDFIQVSDSKYKLFPFSGEFESDAAVWLLGTGAVHFQEKISLN